MSMNHGLASFAGRIAMFATALVMGGSDAVPRRIVDAVTDGCRFPPDIFRGLGTGPVSQLEAICAIIRGI